MAFTPLPSMGAGRNDNCLEDGTPFFSSAKIDLASVLYSKISQQNNSANLPIPTFPKMPQCLRLSMPSISIIIFVFSSATFASFVANSLDSGDENGQLIVEVDKSGEWSGPVGVPPSAMFRLDRIDAQCCWKSRLAIDLVSLSPPYLVVPFGQMEVGEVIDLRELWANTLAAYRTKLDGMARGKKEEEAANEENNGTLAKRRRRRDVLRVETIRLSANCPIRIVFLQNGYGYGLPQ